MTENVTLNFEPEATRHKLGIPSVTGGISHVRTRINKLSRSTNKSFTGTTYVEGTVGQCRLHVFDSNFHFLHTRLSNLDGTYEVNNIYNDGTFYIVCVSLNEECPAISGHLIPPNASLTNSPTITLLGVDEAIPRGKRYEGYLLRASATTVDPYQDEFDVTVVTDPDYIKNYSQTKDIGLFGYQHDHATAAILPTLLPKTINEFDQNASYLLQGSNGNWANDKCDGVIEFIDINGNMVVELEIIGDSGQFRHNLKHRTSTAPTQVIAATSGAYPRVGGDITFTNESLIFVNNKTTNFINDFTINPVNVSAIVGMRITITDVRSNYLSANGGRAFLEFYMDAEYIPVIGATATDPEDGIIGSIITEIQRDGVVVPSIDVDVVGTNIITYSVTDSDNETVQAIQTIEVLPLYDDYILSLLPVVHYPLNDISGTVIVDSISGNNGTIGGTYTQNQPALTTSLDRSIYFNGDAYISTPYTPNLDNDITFSCVISPVEINKEGFILAIATSVGNQLYISLTNTGIVQIVQEVNFAYTTSLSTLTIPLNQPALIVGGYEGNNIFISVNGEQKVFQTITAKPNSNTLQIGRVNFNSVDSSRELKSFVDQVVIFNKALTNTEISNMLDKI